MKRKLSMNFWLKAGLVALLAIVVVRMVDKPDDQHAHMRKFLALSNEELNELPKYDRPDLADLQNFEMTMDPSLGYPPNKRLFSAKKQADQIKSQANKSQQRANSTDIDAAEWVERGPNNFGGRTRGIFFDPNDPQSKKVWAGGVGGGLWYNNDITNPYSSWFVVDDFFGNIAVSDLAFDPVNTQTMYFSTGEGWGNADAIRGDGIWKSTDDGETWTHLQSTADRSDFNWIKKIEVTNNSTILAATRGNGGIYRSTDGGESWDRVVEDNRGSDIEINGNTIYASTYSGVYRSEDDGETWTNISPSGSFDRIEIGVHPNHTNTVYLAAAQGSNVGNLFRSFDKGNTWSEMTIPAYFSQGCEETANDFTRGQAWYDLIVAVDPTDSAVLVVGGIDILKSTDAGNTWNLISYWTGACDEYVHADQHNFIFRPGHPDEAIAATDGGIYYTHNFSNPESNGGPDFTDRNYNYNVAQFYAVAMLNEIGSNYFLAGAQDNGSHAFFEIGVNSTVEVTGGDGAFTFIDQDDPDIRITSYVYNDYYITKDGFASIDNVATENQEGRFINPADYNSNSNILYAAGNTNSMIVYDLNVEDVQPEKVNLSLNGGEVSAVTTSNYSDDVLFLGTGNGNVFLVSDLSGSPESSLLTSESLPGYVSSIDIGKSNDQLLVTVSNYGVESIFESIDGGKSWISKEGNLPDMPVRWCLYNPNDHEEVLIATELGVWFTSSISAQEVEWVPLNNGLANVRCDMLQIRNADHVVAVATHGRGLYTTDVFATESFPDFLVSGIAYTDQEIPILNGSIKAESYSWDFGNGNTSIEKNPTVTYDQPGKYSISLQINGDDTKVQSKEITILPYYSGKYALEDGGDFETNQSDFASTTNRGLLFELGSSTVPGKDGTNSGDFAWVLGLDEEIYLPNSESFLYTPMFDFSLSGEYTLEFYTKYEIEDEWEGFIVEYSTDFGETWTKLSDYLSPDDWYNQSAISTAVVFQSGEPLFSGDTGGRFVKKSTSFSHLSGEANVSFRFAFRTDPATEEAGVAIDDFKLSPPEENPVLNFSTDAETSCTNQVVVVENLSSGDLSQYSWDFGEGAIPQTLQGFGPHEVIYSTAGQKTITLSAISATEGAKTITSTITVEEEPAQVSILETNVFGCSGEGITVLIDNSIEGISYQLLFSGTLETAGEEIQGTGEALEILSGSLSAGTYSLKVLSSNQGLCEVLSNQTINVVVKNFPRAEIERLDNQTLRSTLGEAYQWFLDGDTIPGAISRDLIISGAGSYSVAVSEGTCISFSEELEISPVTGLEDLLTVDIYPNPFVDQLSINFSKAVNACEVNLFDLGGARVYTKSFGSETKYDLNLESLKPGIYYLVVNSRSVAYSQKLMKR